MFDEISGRIGEDLGVGAWMTITQDQVNQFAEVTADDQWIHTDPEQAATGPFGSTIAHGFLTLSLLSALVDTASFPEPATAINYGLNRVRFISPVPVGSRVRARSVLADVAAVSGGAQLTLDVTVEIEGNERPAVVAEWLVPSVGL